MFSSPGFIVVGPKKTGTSWLYVQLQNVKGINLPPFKELSFFYDAQQKQMAKMLAHLPKTYNAIKSYWPEFGPDNLDAGINSLVARLKRSQKEKRKRNFEVSWKEGKYLWSIFFYAIPRGLTAFHFFIYTLLFSKWKPGITGDISPEYFSLSPRVIRKIKRHFPNVKIIFIIRDPVEREWSHIRMSYFKNKYETPSISLDERLDTPHGESDYKRAIENWESSFPREQILYLFYDELQKDPAAFLNTILEFLNCKTPVNRLITEKVGEGLNVDLDEKTKARLLSKNVTQYHFLAQKFGNGSIPALWLKNVLK